MIITITESPNVSISVSPEHIRFDVSTSTAYPITLTT
jgi:hypothetical protein